MAEIQYNVWLDRSRFEDAECIYQEHLAKVKCGGSASTASCMTNTCQNLPPKSTLACEIARAREHIQKSLCNLDVGLDSSLMARIDALEKDNKELKKVTQELRSLVTCLSSRIASFEKGGSSTAAVCPAKPVGTAAANDSKATVKDEEGDEDNFELFDENEEDDEEKERVKQERVKAYEERKAKKPVLIAKSNIILDVKPWDDETDMAKVEECVRSIEMDGLLWGASKLVPLAFGIKKLQISCVVEDDKVSTEDLEERICAFEDYIQSMDIAAFNKI